MLDFLTLLKRKIFFQIFTVYLRYLIGGAFIIAAFGMGKVRGTANLLHSMDHPIEKLQPIQQFFRVMVDSGLYWQFIGWTQILAGLLLMTQKLARVGALIFFVIVLNIFVITISYSFTGTPIVTGLMLLAVTYLLVWDLPVFIRLIKDDFHYEPANLAVADHPFWMWLGSIMVTSIVLLAIAYQNMFTQLAVPLVEGLIGFVIFLFLIRKGK